MTLGTATPHSFFPDAAASDEATVSSALLSVFRGKFCKTLLPGRTPIRLTAGEVLYDIGDQNRSMFFIQKGYDGCEIIYDVRTDGDVVGELCAARMPRRDRGIALEPSLAIEVSYSEVLATLAGYPELLAALIEIFCNCLSDAYDQITTLATHDLSGRVVHALLNVAEKLGQRNGDAIEIPAYLTQEEISQMVGARRERVSTTLNSLRRRGLVDYSRRGRLILYMAGLRNLIA